MPANVVAFTGEVADSVFWAIFGVVLLVGAFKLFDRLDPLHYREEIENGNVGAGVVMAGVMIGIAFAIFAIVQ